MAPLRHHPFVRDEILPSWWANAIQAALSNIVENFEVVQFNATTIRVPASAGEGLAVISIDGRWRWMETNISRVHPGGAAGTFDIYVTAADNDITNVPDTNTDETVYGFSLAIVPAGDPAPATDLSRKVGTLVWSGTAITSVTQTVGRAPAHSGSHQAGGSDDLGVIPIGAQIPYSFSALPPGGKFGWCDGGLIDRTTFAAFYAGAGHSYNGGVDPGGNQVRKPDKRGRAPVGADTMGGGAAGGRIPNSPRARGQSGGEERHQLTVAELASHQHQEIVMFEGPNSAVITGPAPGFATLTHYGTPQPTEFTGNNVPHNVMQPYEVDNWIVRLA